MQLLAVASTPFGGIWDLSRYVVLLRLAWTSVSGSGSIARRGHDCVRDVTFKDPLSAQTKMPLTPNRLEENFYFVRTFVSIVFMSLPDFVLEHGPQFESNAPNNW